MTHTGILAQRGGGDAGQSGPSAERVPAAADKVRAAPESQQAASDAAQSARGHVHLLVLGAGAAGMMTALLAARRGLRVLVIDPAFSQPNNLFISGGLFPAAGSPLQRTAGVIDSPQAWLDDLDAFAGAAVNRPLAAAIARALPELVAFLLHECAAPIRFLPDVPAPGHRVARFHSVVPASGRALHAWLRQSMAQQPHIACLADGAAPIIEREAGQWAWRVGRSSTGSTDDTDRTGSAAAPGHAGTAAFLMLAGGGFGANAQMVAQHVPALRGALHTGAASNDGSCIAMAQTWGAALSMMDGYQGQGHTNPGGMTRLGMSLPTLGAILVNAQGERFVREDVGPSALAAHVLAQPGQAALEVFDAAIETQLGNHSAYADACAAGQVVAADSITALARSAGVPAGALEHTVRACAAYAAGASDPFGRREFVRVLQAPYRASWVTGALAHTQGGAATDTEARVLDDAGRVLPGLYAAGGAAAGLSGRGGDGYLPGNGLAQSFGLAWLAVESMLRQAVTVEPLNPRNPGA